MTHRDQTDANTGAPTIQLDITVCATNQGFRVTFEGPNAESAAIDFLNRHCMDYAVHELDHAPIKHAQFPRLFELLYPTCEHGMSANLCAGPDHYPADM